MPILRYDKTVSVVSSLNPIEDLINWISGLRSAGYSGDIIRSIHAARGTARKISKEATLISQLASNAVGFLEQAYSGPAEVSFLPLYYAVLNLSKACVVLAGKMTAIESQRRHGASYNPTAKTSHDLLTERVSLWSQGALPLYYETLTGHDWSKVGKTIEMREVYPYLPRVGHEYSVAYGRPHGLVSIDVSIEKVDANRFRLGAKTGSSTHPGAGNKRHLKILRDFRRASGDDPRLFVGRSVVANSEGDARARLLHGFRRHLIYLSRSKNEIRPLTPICTMNLQMAEEIPVWLVLFHLSNVVRYNPEFLARLGDSRTWPLLLALRRHSVLQFLILFWSFVNQANFHLIHE